MMWWNGGWGVGGWIAMSLMMVVFWGGLIALVIWLIRSSSSRAQRPSNPSGPPVDPTEHGEQVLAERFARGEIDEDEYIHRRELLHQR